MLRRRAVATGVAVALAMSGCAALHVTQENQTACRVAWVLLGAAAGGTGVGVAVAEGADPSNAAVTGAVAGGALAGGMLGWLAGNYICAVPEEALPPHPQQ
jgi:hypothetical protein